MNIRSLAMPFILLLTACGGGSSNNTPDDPTTTPPPESEPEPNSVNLILDTTTRYQTLEGFGASVAWYGERLLTHPKAEELQKVVFADLGVDILRLRNRYQRSGENFSFDDERKIVAAATASLSREPGLLMTSWSPPADLKANADDDCNGNSDCTLKKVDGEFAYGAFGQYWRDSLEAYHAHGLVPAWISIQNEPNFIPYGWEGNKLTTTEGEYPAYGTALNAVHNALEGLSDRPGLLGPENLGAHYNTAANYLRHLDQSLLAGVAHHLYERGNDAVWDWREPGPDSYVEPMLTIVEEANGLPIFMTEFQTDEDEGIDGGFETAWLIHNSLVEANHVAWLYWDLIWVNNSGLVAITDNDYTLRDQYYALRHYSLYTDPGYERVSLSSSHDDIRASAFIAPDDSRVTMVVLNVGEDEQVVDVAVAERNPSQIRGFLTTYEPGHSSTWVPMSDFGDDLKITLPARSQATLVLE